VDGPTAILVAIISSAGLVTAALVGALVQTRRIGRGTGGSLVSKWRENYEAAQARAELMEEQRDDEHKLRLGVQGQREADRLAWERREGELLARVASTELDLDTCSRQLDDARSEVREIRRGQPGPAS